MLYVQTLGEKRRLPFLESMIERAHHGDGLTDQEIKNQVNTIMFEVSVLKLYLNLVDVSSN